MMQGAWALVSTEAIKIRRTLALWLVVVAPALAFTMVLILLFNRNSSSPIEDATTMWRSLLGTAWGFWLGLVTPILISFETASLANLEHGGNHWKQLFAFPIPRWSVYATKMVFCGLLVGASFLVVVLGFIGDGLIFGAVRGLPLASAIPWGEILHLAGKAYVASWLVIAIQSWLSARFFGIATPAGLGFAALVIGFGLLGVPGGHFSWWYPWTLPLRTLSGGPRDLHDTVWPAVFGCAGGVLVGALACWDLARRREGD
jgi:hypothetical protein